MAKQDEELHEMWEVIKRIDEAIRGNGRAGIQTRLDRLERMAGMVNRLVWIAVAGFASVAASALIYGMTIYKSLDGR